MHINSDAEICPECDSCNTVPVSTDNLMRCKDCGAYFDAVDDLEGTWDRSSRHRTRMDDGFEFDD